MSELSLSFLSGATRVNGAIAVVVAQILIAKIVGLEQFGVLSQAVAIYAIAEAVVVTRAGDLGIYVVAQATGRRGTSVIRFKHLVLSDVIFGLAVSGSVVALAECLYADRPAVAHLISIFAIALPLSTGYGYWRNVAYLRGTAHAFLIVEAVLPWIRAIVSVIAALRWGPKGVAISEVIYVVQRSLLFYCAQRRLSVDRPERLGGRARSSWRDRVVLLGVLSAASIGRNLLGSALGQIDVIWAGFKLEDGEIGVYRLVKTMASGAGVVASAAWFPQRRSLVGVSREVFPWTVVKRTLGVIGLWLFALTGLALVLWRFLSEVLHKYSENSEEKWSLVVLMWASGIEVGMSAWSSVVIAAFGWPWIGVLAALCGLVVFSIGASFASEPGVLGIGVARLVAVSASGTFTVALLLYRIGQGKGRATVQ